MCESVMKFESKRPGALSDLRDSITTAQYSHIINVLNTQTDRLFLLLNILKYFIRHRENRNITANFESLLRKDTVLIDHPLFSNIITPTKSAIAAIFKRNKTKSNIVDTGYRIAFLQLV